MLKACSQHDVIVEPGVIAHQTQYIDRIVNWMVFSIGCSVSSLKIHTSLIAPNGKCVNQKIIDTTF